MLLSTNGATFFIEIIIIIVVVDLADMNLILSYTNHQIELCQFNIGFNYNIEIEIDL